ASILLASSGMLPDGFSATGVALLRRRADVRVAEASRVLTMASSSWRTCRTRANSEAGGNCSESSFRRDARSAPLRTGSTGTRDACATQTPDASIERRLAIYPSWIPARNLSEGGIGRFPKDGQEFRLFSITV